MHLTFPCAFSNCEVRDVLDHKLEATERSSFASYGTLTHSALLDPNGCCSKGSAPYWSNPSFLIFDIRALWRSGLSARVPECQKLKIVGYTSMSKCKALTKSAVKGLTTGRSAVTISHSRWTIQFQAYIPECKVLYVHCTLTSITL